MELIATPDNPVPPGAIVTPVVTDDHVVLRVARWPGEGDRRGTVCIFTGRGEFIEKYFETVSELLGRGFSVVTLDWRGQGLSARPLADPRKGHVDDFDAYARDIAALDQQVLRFLCQPPFFAIGHSMGGAILLAQALGAQSPFERLVVTAPMVDLHGLRFPGAIRALAEAADLFGLGRFYIPGGKPDSSMAAAFSGNVLTSDKRRFARNAGIVRAAPKLAVGDPTFAWVNAAFRLMARFVDPDVPPPARVPVLAFSAGDDRVVSTPAIHRILAGWKTSIVLPLAGAQHEILQERDEIREQFWAAFDAFVPGKPGDVASLAETITRRQEARRARAPRLWGRARKPAAVELSRS